MGDERLGKGGRGPTVEDDWEDETVGSVNGDVQGVYGEKLLGDLVARGGFGGLVRRDYGGESDVDSDGGDADEGNANGSAAWTQEKALELRMLAATFQEASRATVVSQLPRGIFPPVGPDRVPPKDEKAFQCNRVFNVTDLETAGGIYEAVKKSPVVAEVIGATGVGKSTKLCAHIAVKCGVRVLQITPDAVLSKQHGEALSEILKPVHIWPSAKGAALVLMTPQQFCGRFYGDGWEIMMSMFEVIVVDEAHIPTRYYGGIRSALSTKSSGRSSFLMMTATAKGQADLQSARDAPEYMPVRMETIASDVNFLDGPFAVDRTMFIAESDERVRSVAEMLMANGAEVLVLESSASEAHVNEVSRRFMIDSAALRLLVAHERFGTGYNMPVERVVTTGLRRILIEKDGVFSYASEPLSVAEVRQHMGRAGRGIRPNARRGVVLLPQTHLKAPSQLLTSEAFSTYVLLVAMGINPGRKMQEAVAEALPFGLTQRVAVAIMQVFGLPPEVTVRFLASDGRFPRKYAAALSCFSTARGVPLISEFDEPVHWSEWPEVEAFSVLGETGGPRVKVPVRADGELAAILAFVCASAEGVYVPVASPARFDEGYESGPEVSGGTTVRRLPKVRPRVPLMVLPVSQERFEDDGVSISYSYDVPIADQAKYGRRAAVVIPGIVAEHLGSDGFKVGVPDVSRFTDANGREYVRLGFPEGSPVEVSSPGGSVAVVIPASVWAVMSKGEPLTLRQFKGLVNKIGRDPQRFAESSAFAHWNSCWLSVLRSLADPDILRYVREKNFSSFCVAMCGQLWERYVMGMRSAVDASHPVLRWWEKLVISFGSDGARMHSRKASRGDAAVAQTEDFRQRLYDIRMCFAQAMVAFESSGFFVPEAMAELQMILPISTFVGNRTVDSVRTGRAQPWRVRSLSGASEDEVTVLPSRQRLADRFNR